MFAPLEQVGLIVVDEEHDGSYKQEESPRYNGRDVAIVRGAARRRARRARLGDAVDGELPQRADRQATTRRRSSAACSIGRWPRSRVVDMREEYAADGPGRDPQPRRCATAIGDALERGEQALVLLNRRGFATRCSAASARGTLDCPNCSVSLVVHGEGHARRARCHYCNYSARVPEGLPAVRRAVSRAGRLRHRARRSRGPRALFPAARVARLDRDAIRRKGALAALLASSATARSTSSSARR